MCKCSPEVKTPFCGKGDCQWPGLRPENSREESVSQPHVMNEEKMAKAFEEVCRQLKEKEVELSAWKAAFGSSQLTHAKCNFDQAVKEANAAREKSVFVKDLESDC